MEVKMTIIDAIHMLDKLKPNTYSQVDKIRWLSELDGIIKTEIIDTHEGSEKVVFNGYDENSSLEIKLIVSAPYDDIYIKWLESKIDYTNAEYSKYNNSLTAFKDAYSTFERYYNRHNMPKKTKLKFF
jgi:hypothetical protein